MQQTKGFTLAEDLAAIVKRIENRYRFTNVEERAIISFESSPAVQGVENLEDIYLAIVRKKVLKLCYKTFRSATPCIWHIHPYLLKEYAHRWYLFGYAQEKENPGVFALDRMEEIKVSRLAYRENTFIHSEDYFRDVIGVTVFPNQTLEEIELVFSPKINPYILTKPLHHSQEVLHHCDDGSLHVRCTLMINPEFISLLLSYGSDVQVLKPKCLADEIKKIAIALLEHYK
ncbi:MAG TPA: WYL domain-containing protein [Flavipsychrobacter sp.]|nr:WYL domain-containing protein [Flavipsychrobacter sp.]